MIYYSVSLDGSDIEIKKMLETLSETNDDFSGLEKARVFDFTDDGNYDLTKDELEEAAIEMAKAVPGGMFTIKGKEMSEADSDCCSFEYTFCDGVLSEKSSGWYKVEKCNDYSDYDEFCECTDYSNKTLAEEFEYYRLVKMEIAILSNGEFVCLDDLPFKTRNIEWKEVNDC